MPGPDREPLEGFMVREEPSPIGPKTGSCIRAMMGSAPQVILDRVERLPLFPPRLCRRLAG